MSIEKIAEELMVAAAELRLSALQYAIACATAVSDTDALKSLAGKVETFGRELALEIELARQG